MLFSSQRTVCVCVLFWSVSAIVFEIDDEAVGERKSRSVVFVRMRAVTNTAGCCRADFFAAFYPTGI